MNYHWTNIFKESAPLLAFMAFIGMLGGQILHSIEEVLLIFPVILFLLPIMNGLGGNLGAILGARISSGLHSGYINPSIMDKEMDENMLLTLLTGGITYGALALGIVSSTKIIPLNIYAMNLIIIIMGAGAIITIGTMLMTVGIAIWSYKRNLDPDNIVLPVITTLADFLSIISLFFMVWLVIL